MIQLLYKRIWKIWKSPYTCRRRKKLSVIRHNEVLDWSVYDGSDIINVLTSTVFRFVPVSRASQFCKLGKKKRGGQLSFVSFWNRRRRWRNPGRRPPDGLLLFSAFGNNHKNWERLLLLLLASSSLFLGVLWFIITWPRPPWPVAASEAVPPRIPFFSSSLK